MEETKSLWNKTVEEMTVKDHVIVAVAVPAAAVGSIVALALVAEGIDKARSKFRTIRENRKNKNTEIAES